MGEKNHITYRLRNTTDPEERLEDAAMWKALHDASDGEITITDSEDATFGVIGDRFHHKETLPYWDDPAFLKNCGREFQALPLDDASKAVADLHRRGKDAYVKACLDKYFNCAVLRGSTLERELDALIYSFCDSKRRLMVQELVDFTFEHRFFVIGRQVITWSPAAYTLTPLDFPLQDGIAWRKQSDRKPEPFINFDKMLHLASKVAAQMRTADGAIDIGMIGKNPAIVEFNPLRCGQVGLFACDVRKLAAAFYAQAIEAGDIVGCKLEGSE